MERSEISRDCEGYRKYALLTLHWYGKAAEVETSLCDGKSPSYWMALHVNEIMTKLWHPRDNSNVAGDTTTNSGLDLLPRHSHIPLCTRLVANKGGDSFSNPWKNCCAICRCQEQLWTCASCKAFFGCSKKCQVEYWKVGHKDECKTGSFWLESFFPSRAAPY